MQKLSNLIERKISEALAGRDKEWVGVVLRDTREMNEHATIKEFENVLMLAEADLTERRAKTEREIALAVVGGESTDGLRWEHVALESQISALDAVGPIFKSLQSNAEMRLRELTQES